MSGTTYLHAVKLHSIVVSDGVVVQVATSLLRLESVVIWHKATKYFLTTEGASFFHHFFVRYYLDIFSSRIRPDVRTDSEDVVLYKKKLFFL